MEKATSHFREKLSAAMKTVDVPEWSCKIYFKNSVNLKDQSKLIELASTGKTVEALVETLIVKARNEDGTKMFNMPDKVILMNEVDPQVVIRIVGEMNAASDEDTLETVEKNS
jgi:hypothetical protein